MCVYICVRMYVCTHRYPYNPITTQEMNEAVAEKVAFKCQQTKSSHSSDRFSFFPPPFYSSDNYTNKPDSANLFLSNSLIKTIYCYHCDFSRTSKPHSKSKQQRSSVCRCARHVLLSWQPHN